MAPGFPPTLLLHGTADEMLNLTIADVALFIERVLVNPARYDIPQAELFGQPSPTAAPSS